MTFSQRGGAFRQYETHRPSFQSNLEPSGYSQTNRIHRNDSDSISDQHPWPPILYTMKAKVSELRFQRLLLDRICAELIPCRGALRFHHAVFAAAGNPF